jgi:hypothetical protein
VTVQYVEPGGSWRPFWLVAGALALLLGMDLVLPGPDVPPLLWALSLVVVLGIVAAGALSAARVWTVRVASADTDGGDPQPATGLPLRLTDGRTVLVPTRDPVALTRALLAAAPAGDAGGTGAAGTGPTPGLPGTEGTLGP